MHECGQITFKPGQTVIYSGIYTVEHHRHRLNHCVTILEGSQFPACRRCGEQVTFLLERKVPENKAVFGNFREVLEEYSNWKKDDAPVAA